MEPPVTGPNTNPANVPISFESQAGYVKGVIGEVKKEGDVTVATATFNFIDQGGTEHTHQVTYRHKGDIPNDALKQKFQDNIDMIAVLSARHLDGGSATKAISYNAESGQVRKFEDTQATKERNKEHAETRKYRDLTEVIFKYQNKVEHKTGNKQNNYIEKWTGAIRLAQNINIKLNKMSATLPARSSSPTPPARSASPTPPAQSAKPLQAATVSNPTPTIPTTTTTSPPAPRLTSSPRPDDGRPSVEIEGTKPREEHSTTPEMRGDKPEALRRAPSSIAQETGTDALTDDIDSVLEDVKTGVERFRIEDSDSSETTSDPTGNLQETKPELTIEPNSTPINQSDLDRMLKELVEQGVEGNTEGSQTPPSLPATPAQPAVRLEMPGPPTLLNSANSTSPQPQATPSLPNNDEHVGTFKVETREATGAKVESAEVEKNNRLLEKTLQEIATSEQSFLNRAKTIQTAYKVLANTVTDNQVLNQFNQTLATSIPIFESFNQALQKIQNTEKSIDQKQADILSLYESDSGQEYLKALTTMGDVNSNLMPFDETFADQFEKLEVSSFDKMNDHPIIFTQRPVKHIDLLKEILKKSTGSEERIDSILKKLDALTRTIGQDAALRQKETPQLRSKDDYREALQKVSESLNQAKTNIQKIQLANEMVPILKSQYPQDVLGRGTSLDKKANDRTKQFKKYEKAVYIAVNDYLKERLDKLKSLTPDTEMADLAITSAKKDLASDAVFYVIDGKHDRNREIADQARKTSQEILKELNRLKKPQTRSRSSTS